MRRADPGLFGPGSMVWRIHREAAVLAGGQRALLLQVAHPLVAAAVAEHSGFPADAWKRLRRTLDSALAIAFGTTEEAHGAIAGINAVHERVAGSLRAGAGGYAAGAPYRATDPDLLRWVHATLVDSALETYATFVGPLSDDERERYCVEIDRVAQLLGAASAPPTYAAFRDYVQGMLGELAVGEDARRLARSVLNPPPRLVSGVVFWPAAALTAGLLPAPVREAFGIPFGRARRAAFATASRTARATVPRLPARLRFASHARAAARRVGVRTP